ncbi:hypothetical protein NPN23_24215 [Vibrio parahaemolyticus]|nr:hypothetical protein [Vibrio parahaemolyticus]
MALVAYAVIVSSIDFIESEYYTPDYTNDFLFGGVKLKFDGSPQG